MKNYLILGFFFATLWVFAVQAQTINFPDSCFSGEIATVDYDDFDNLGDLDDDIIVMSNSTDDECIQEEKVTIAGIDTVVLVKYFFSTKFGTPTKLMGLKSRQPKRNDASKYTTHYYRIITCKELANDVGLQLGIWTHEFLPDNPDYSELYFIRCCYVFVHRSGNGLTVMTHDFPNNLHQTLVMVKRKITFDWRYRMKTTGHLRHHVPIMGEHRKSNLFYNIYFEKAENLPEVVKKKIVGFKSTEETR